MQYKTEIQLELTHLKYKNNISKFITFKKICPLNREILPNWLASSICASQFSLSNYRCLNLVVDLYVVPSVVMFIEFYNDPFFCGPDFNNTAMAF